MIQKKLLCTNTICSSTDATVKAGIVTLVTGNLAAKELIKQGVLTENVVTDTTIACIDFIKDAAGGITFELGYCLGAALPVPYWGDDHHEHGH